MRVAWTQWPPAGSPSRRTDPLGAPGVRGLGWRLGLWLGLAFSWLLSLPFGWHAFTTVPAAERLSRSHLVAIPTLHTFLLQVGGSALELVVVLAWLWPGRARWWLARQWLAALGLLLYFLATPPLGL